MDCRTGRGRVARAVFPPEQVAEAVAVACELPARHERPLGRFSGTELHRLVIEQGITEASATTVWRWLHDRSLKPWQQRSWIFPRDPDFQPKAGRVLDLYARRFEGRRLHPGEYVICADEKSQLQALARRHATVPAAPGRAALVEFEYRRGGTLAYLAAWDVHHARLFGRCESKTGIEPFGRLGEDRVLDRRQRLKPRRPGLDRPARERLSQRAADPPADPRLVAQSDRDLLLDPAAQGPDPQRLRRPRRARRPHRGLRGPLPPDRQAVRLELQPLRPRRAARSARQPRAAAAPGRLTATPPTARRPASAPPRRAPRPPGSRSRQTAAATRSPDRSARPPPRAAHTGPHPASRSPPAPAAPAQAACRAHRIPPRSPRRPPVHHPRRSPHRAAQAPARAAREARPAATNPDTADRPTPPATTRTHACSTTPPTAPPHERHSSETPARDSPPTAPARSRNSA